MKAIRSNEHTLKVLTFFFHDDPNEYVTGGFLRFVEILRRSKFHGLEFDVIENKPAFKRLNPDLNYNSYEVTNILIKQKELDRSFLKSVRLVVDGVIAGFHLCNYKKYDLILSPCEIHPLVLTAFFTAKLSKLPWTAVFQMAPAECNMTSFFSIYKYFRKKQSFSRTMLHSILLFLMATKVYRDTKIVLVSSSLEATITNFSNENYLTLHKGNASRFENLQLIDNKKSFDGLFAGRLVAEKGIFDLVKVWKLIVLKYPFSKLLIVGPGKPETKEALLDFISENGLNKNITVMGFVSESSVMAQLMNQSKLMVYPSIQDTYPLVVGEGLSLGLPVICYDIPAMNHYQYNLGLFKVPIGNLEMMAEKILYLLDNPLMIQKIKETPKVLGNSWDDVINEEKDTYDQVIAFHMQKIKTIDRIS